MIKTKKSIHDSPKQICPTHLGVDVICFLILQSYHLVSYNITIKKGGGLILTVTGSKITKTNKGVFGAIRQPACLIISLILLAIFMGASSNFTVSAAAQYWRREDFSSVFSCLNPVANIFNAIAPTVIAFLLYTSIGYQLCFIVTAIAGVIGLILILLFSPAHIKMTDDKYRSAAGKTLDDALLNRK